jgi:ribosome-associated GTPase EngA
MSNGIESTRRSIAIVGRPNVGKSAVFNRVAKSRIAIVHAEAGVTRDRLVREVWWGERRFPLIDTGGIMNIDGKRIADEIDAGIRAQADAALMDAAVVIFVTDAQAGVTPLDAEVARLLRRGGATVLLAANKCDTVEMDNASADFARLGFPVHPVSALHGRGFQALMDAAVKLLPPDDSQLGAGPDDEKEKLCVAIVGRPNAGKSSFVNRLIKKERVIVSDVPGTTRDSIDVPFSVEGRQYTLIDTAGARREARVDTAVERYSRFRMQESVERADIVVLMLDATRGAGLLDKQLAGLVSERGKGCVIVINKWDLAGETEEAFAERLEHDLKFMAYCPIIFTSMASGHNVSRVMAAIDHVAAQCRAKLPTGILNRTVAKAAEAMAGAGKGGQPFKIYYATQVGVNPIIIRLFVNDAKRLPGNYEQYIINSLRRELGLEGAVLRLQFRARPRKEQGAGVGIAGMNLSAGKTPNAGARKAGARSAGGRSASGGKSGGVKKTGKRATGKNGRS